MNKSSVLRTMIAAGSALLAIGAVQNRIVPSAVPPLIEAIWRENTAAIDHLLASGEDPGARDPGDDLGRTPWMWAMTARNSAALNLLLARIPAIGREDVFAQQRLEIAATLNDVAAARTLVDRGVSVNVRGAAGHEQTPLAVAASSGYTGFMQFLLEHGADVNATDRHGDTPLMNAVRAGSAEGVRLLLAAHADVNRADGEGRTALMWASWTGRADITESLLAAGARLDSADKVGRTAMSFATEKGNDDVIRLLRDKGVRGALAAPQRFSTRAAVEKSLPLLQRGAAAWAERQQCSSCHHQPMILRVTAVALERGFAVDRELADAQLRRVAPSDNPQRRALAQAPDLDVLRFSLRTGGDPSFANAWFQSALVDIGFPRDATREANAILQSRMQLPDGRWRFGPPRVPIESSDFTATALAVRLLQGYGPADHALDFAERINRARQWLIVHEPATTDDKVFRLFGLVWSGADPATVRSAADLLRREQRSDGGWSQIPGLNSDAYATGLVLVALHQGSGVAATDPSYIRGVQYLLRTQEADGSWLAHTRANPVNAYFESGFPHGKFQFISFAGTCWATMALMYAT